MAGGKRAGFFLVERRLLPEYAGRVGPSGILVYLSLLGHANRSGLCFPSQQTIARETTLDLKTVRAALAALQAAGLAEIRVRRGRAMLYRLLPLPPPRGLFDVDLAPEGETSSAERWGKFPHHLGKISPSDGEIFPTNDTQGTRSKEQQQQQAPTAAEGVRVSPETKPVPAAAADNASMSSPQRDGGPVPAKATLAEALHARGLSLPLAERASETADPALIREILVHFDVELPGLRNPVGALRSMVESPLHWGFEPVAGGWKRPPPSKRIAVSGETERLAAHRQRVLQENLEARAVTADRAGLEGEDRAEFIRTGRRKQA